MKEERRSNYPHENQTNPRHPAYRQPAENKPSPKPEKPEKNKPKPKTGEQKGN